MAAGPCRPDPDPFPVLGSAEDHLDSSLGAAAVDAAGAADAEIVVAADADADAAEGVDHRACPPL